MRALAESGQGQLFASWPPLGTSDADKRRMAAQLVTLDARSVNILYGGNMSLMPLDLGSKRMTWQDSAQPQDCSLLIIA